MPINLAVATRDLIRGGVQEEVYRRMAFIDELQKRKQIITSGGTAISKNVDYAEVDDLAQSYKTGEALTDGEKTMLAKASFNWKKTQIPVKYDGDVEIQNMGAAGDEQLIDLAEYLATKATRGIKLKLEKMIANAGSTITTDYNDTGANFNSMVHALKHVTTTETYGNIARGMTAGKNNWWQGADIGQIIQNVPEGTAPAASSQATAVNLTLANLRQWIIPVQHSIRAKKDLMVVMCPTLFNKLKAECQAQMIYEPSKDTANVGFNKMYVDGHQIVDWDYLETSSTMKKWVFIINLDTWELHFNKARNFKMTSFKWAGELPNGYDYYLARILLAGNLCCWQPNANLFLSNVS